MRAHLLVVAAVLAAPLAVAKADVPPPSGYVETCFLEEQCPNGRACGNGPSYSKACVDGALDAGMEERCTSWGASTGHTIYCPIGAPKPPPRTKEPSADGNAPGGATTAHGGCRGCTTMARRDGLEMGLLVGAVAGAALLLRRGRDRAKR
jgi:hypothetical protein